MPEKRARSERIAPNAEPPNGRLTNVTRRSLKALRRVVEAIVRLLAVLLPGHAAQRPRRSLAVDLLVDPHGETPIRDAGRCKSRSCSPCTASDRGSRTTRRSAKHASADREALPKARLARRVLHPTEAA